MLLAAIRVALSAGLVAAALLKAIALASGELRGGAALLYGVVMLRRDSVDSDVVRARCGWGRSAVRSHVPRKALVCMSGSGLGHVPPHSSTSGRRPGRVRGLHGVSTQTTDLRGRTADAAYEGSPDTAGSMSMVS